MLGMSKKPILEIARPGYSLNGIDSKDISFSSKWETPKIFMQTSSSWTNTLGYVPSLLTFRKLNSTDYTYDLQSSTEDTDPYQGAYLDSSGNLQITKRTGDTDMYTILFFNTLDGTPPNTLTDTRRAKLLIAKEGVGVTAYPTQLAIDSRFDTFKIYKSGTLSVTAPAETITAGSSDRVYTSTFNHNLGYPPVYLPMASTRWRLDDSAINNVSFTVNDYVGFPNPYYLSSDMLDVYVDSSNLYMKLTRFADPYCDRTFLSNITITMYYTVFYNRIGEEFNLLSN